MCAQHVNKHQSGSAGSVLKNGIVMVAIPTDTLFTVSYLSGRVAKRRGSDW